MNCLEILSALASVATAVAVFFAALQLRHALAQAVAEFEDAIAKEYRELASELPTSALLGEALNDEDYKESLDEFYHYFDLSNEQIFLRQRGRITSRTWIMWRDGIRSNMRRTAFAKAWEEIKRRSEGDFSELRRLEKSEFKDDPRNWPKEAA